MKRIYRTLLLSSSLGLQAATIDVNRDLEDNDIRALKEWIDTKRQVSLKEIGGDLSISGEVRTEFQNSWESRNGRRLRGTRESDLFPARGFDIEFNLMFDYRTDRTWAAVKIEFDNNAGVFSGSVDALSLEKCYWGVRAVSCDTATLDIEVGRRPFLNVFDSKIEFGSTFDGILFRFARSYEKIGDHYLHIGPFVINERRDHFGYIAETGLLNIGGTGFYTKVSLVDWHTKHYQRSFVDNRFRFLVFQWIPAYRFKIGCKKRLAIIYTAFLYNFLAKRLPVSDNKRANYGGYVGFAYGQLLKQWDWAFDINYQFVQAQAIPDFDVSGIGLGNANRSGFYTETLLPLNGPTVVPTTVQTAGGMTNYRGFIIRFDILLTDKLDMQQSYQQSITLDSDIGPFRRYKQYEMEFIYSW
ncbi:MAG: hypothetical protein JSS30_00430 [Verrucomicrobia bacterium]|nr:hypothetical protein [Verrucomicrobiota bacterium]